MTLLAALLIALLPWFSGGADDTGLFLTHTLVLLMAAVAVARAAARGGLDVRTGWAGAAGLGLVAVCLVSFLTVDYRFGPFLTVWNVLIALILGVVLTVQPARGVLLPQVAAVAAALQAILALVSVPVPNMTPTASFANGNQLAGYLLIGALAAAGLALRARRAPEGGVPRIAPAIAWGSLAALDVAALLRLGSRGALLSLMAVGTAWVIVTPPRSRRARGALAAAGVILIAASALAVARRFDRIEDPYRYDRLRIWEASLGAAADHPLLGMGPGMFARRGAPYNFPQDEAMFRYAKIPGSTHSAWLQALVETGAAGLAAALLLSWLLARAAMAAARRSGDPVVIGIALALMAILLLAIVDTPFDVPAITLTLIALVWPLVLPASPREAPLAASWRWESRAPRARAAAACAVVALIVAHAAAVGVPYAAHRIFRSAIAGPEPAAGISLAMRLEPWNPLYPATRADMIARRRAPLDPEALARAHLDLRTAHRLDPGDPDHPLALGRLHARACFDLPCDPAAVARAERFYREAIAGGRKDPRPHAELATFLLAVGRPDDAADLLERAVALEPRFVEGWLFLARARLDAGQGDAARSALERLGQVRTELKGYDPRNGYERDLMKLDTTRLAEMERRLRQAGG